MNEMIKIREIRANMDRQTQPYLVGNMNKYKRTRVLYILEAALEYFFALMLTGAYIAKVATEIGMSDSLVGILSTASTLGCTFQLFAIFLATMIDTMIATIPINVVINIIFNMLLIIMEKNLRCVERMSFMLSI